MAKRRGTVTQARAGLGAYKPGKAKPGGVGLGPLAPKGPMLGQPGAPSQPAPAPAPASSPVGGPPVDPALVAQQAQARTAMGLGDVWDTYQQGRVNLDYGFNPAGGIDAGNPYSRASLLQKSYEQGQRGTTNSMAAAGQHYSGAASRARDSGARSYDIGIDQLKKGQGDALTGILKGKVDRYSQYGGQMDQAALDSILKALGG